MKKEYYELHEFYTRLVQYPPYKVSLREEFGSKTESYIAGINNNCLGRDILDRLYDFTNECVDNHGNEVYCLYGEGPDKEITFPISIMNYGPLFWVNAPEFDKVGYFTTFWGSYNYIQEEWLCLINPEQEPSVKEIEAQLEWWMADWDEDIDEGLLETTENEIEKDRTLIFQRELNEILQNVNITKYPEEKAPIIDNVYNVSYVTGMICLQRKAAYKQQFGKTPDWLLRLHPSIQSSLYALARSHEIELPEKSPFD